MIRHPSHADSHTREEIGFLCRWGLLAVACGALAVILYAAVAVAVAIPRELEANIVLPDAIWQAGHRERAHLRGRLLPPGLGEHSCCPIVTQAGEAQRFAPLAEQMLSPRLGPAGPGLHRVRLRGSPYDSLASQCRQALVRVVPPERLVFLLDARLAVEARATDAAGLGTCLAQMRRHGAVAFFHPGPLDSFPASRGRLRRIAHDVPALCSVRQPHEPMDVVWHAAWTLNRKEALLTVVTHDADLAAEARKAGFITWLVSARPAREAGGDAPRRFGGLPKLKEYLAGRPIPETGPPGAGPRAGARE